MSKRPVLGLFEGLGVEIEYAIVSRDTLNVLPVSDEVIRRAAGKYSNDYEHGRMGWSNEFVLHVMEIKNMEPVPSFKGLSKDFHRQITGINKILGAFGGLLMPSGMHPWMDPASETRIWPHRYRGIYNTYDKIFNCRRHGWANIQSIHVNISFNGDEELARIHTAIRLLLPIIPALAASSPVADGRITGYQDTRLFHYRTNQRKVPSIMGKIIPEPVYTGAGYRSGILEKMYRDISKYDPGEIIQNEWLNSRGVIPRFDRNAMEIRVIDTQECPEANIAVADLIVCVLKMLVSEQWSFFIDQKRWKTSSLVSIFGETIEKGEKSVIDNKRYLDMFGFPISKARAGELWRHLADEAIEKKLLHSGSKRAIGLILDQGTLSRRILKALGRKPSLKRIKEIYGKLCRRLAANELFTG